MTSVFINELAGSSIREPRKDEEDTDIERFYQPMLERIVRTLHVYIRR